MSATLVSQAASSLSNAAVLLVAAGLMSGRDLGTVASCMLVYQTALGLGRALFGEIALVRRRLIGDLGASQMMTATLLYGFVSGIGLATGALFLPDSIQGPMRTLAVFLPALLLHDAWRYIAFADRVPMRAALGDVVWLAAVVALGLTASLAGTDYVGPQTAIAAWGLVGSLSLLAMRPRSMRCASVHSAIQWMRLSARWSRYFILDYVAISIAVNAIAVTVGAVGGLEEFGYMRLAMAYLGPVAISSVAAANFLTPRIANAQICDARYELASTVVLVCFAIVWSSVALILPEHAMQRLVGGGWSEIRSWIIWIGLSYAGNSLYSGATIGLRVRGWAAIGTAIRVVLLPFSTALPILGYVFWAQRGFGSGGMLAGVLYACAAWPALLRRLSRQGSVVNVGP